MLADFTFLEFVGALVISGVIFKALDLTVGTLIVKIFG